MTIERISNGSSTVSLISGNVLTIRKTHQSGLSPDSDGLLVNSYTIRIAQQAAADTAIAAFSSLLAFLKAAVDFHDEDEPQATTAYYLERKPTGATNTEYSLIKQWDIPGYDSPHEDIFARFKITGITLNIRHEGWTENAPGTGTTLQLTQLGYPSTTYATYIINNYDPFALWKLAETSGSTAVNATATSGLDGTYDTVTLANLTFLTGDKSAFIDLGAGNVDIYSAALNTNFDGDEGAVVCWMNTTGVIWTSGNEAWLLKISTSTSSLEIYKTTTDNRIIVTRTADDETVTATADDIDLTDQWFTVSVEWSVTDEFMKLYINGGLIETVPITAPWSGSLSSSGCYIGAEDGSGTNSLSSDMSHVQIYDAVQGPAAIQDITAAAFLTLLPQDDIAFIANKHNTPAFTHIYYYDASGTSFSSNLKDAALPYDLLPSTPAVNDIIYFGIAWAAGIPWGAIDNLTFDISIGSAGVTLATQVYTGSWTTLTAADHNLRDDTVSLSRSGIHYVTWTNPSGVTNTTVNSVAGIWVRMIVTAVGSGTITPPRQANNHPYLINWAFAEIDSTQAKGDIDAMLRWYLHGTRYFTNAAASKPNRLIAGLRSISRGDEFTAYLHMNQGTLPPGISVSVTGGGNFSTEATLVAYAVKRVKYTTPAGALGYTTAVQWRLSSAIAGQYKGRFRAIARVGYDTGIADGDFSFRLRVAVGTLNIGNSTYYGPITPYTSTSTAYTYQTVDFGNITVLGKSSETVQQLTFALEIAHTAGANPNNLYMYDLVLIPIDEWTTEASSLDTSVYIASPSVNATIDPPFLDLDGITPYPLAPAVLRVGLAGNVSARFKGIQATPPIARHGRTQRLWVFMMTGTKSTVNNALPDMLLKVEGKRNGRYMAMRGGS